MDKKKKVNCILIIISVLILATVAWASFYFIKGVFNSIIPPKKTEELNLTKEQKLEDFNYLYDTICNSVPMIDCYSDLYGFSFKDRKEIYEKLVLDTKSDLEFYAVMDCIIQEVPSFHTDMVLPGEVAYLNCYNSKRVSSDRGVVSMGDYWKGALNDSSTELDNSSFLTFTYVDGLYYYDPSYSSDGQLAQYDSILSIDGKSIDDFIKTDLSLFNLHYDGQYKKTYRTRIMFNDSYGKKHDLQLLHKDESVSTITVYSSNYYNELYLWSVYQNDDTEPEVQDFVIQEDDDNKVTYIRLNSVGETDGDKVASAIKNIKYDNVILDLRDNYGGNVQYAADYIYPYLFSDDIDESNYWFMPSTDENNSIFRYNLMNYVVLKPSKAKDSPYKNSPYGYKKCLVKQKYRGKLKENKNVIILTGAGSGSACDRFVSDMRKNKMAKVIGNNTGGEGLEYSYNCIALPNSKLAFVYMLGGAVNPDGTDNSVYGTAPDDYVSKSADDFYEEYANISQKIIYDEVIQYAVGLF